MAKMFHFFDQCKAKKQERNAKINKNALFEKLANRKCFFF